MSSNTKNIVGIDPGKQGAIAVLTPEQTIDILKLEEATDVDIVTFLTNHWPGVAYIEQVGTSPNQGRVSAFNFGMSYGSLRMAVVATGFRLETVMPRKWQTALRVKKVGGGFGVNTTEKKRATKARAQELFPDLKITHAIADALLLMEYARVSQGVPR